ESLHEQGLLSDEEYAQARERTTVKPGRRWVAWWPLAAALLGLALILVALFGITSSSQPRIPVNGAVAVADQNNALPDDAAAFTAATQSGRPPTGLGCHTGSGDSDIAVGTKILIADDKHRTLSTTALTRGVFSASGYCVFGFVTTVSRQSSGYFVTVATRDPVSIPLSQIALPQLVL
ncbi:MAG: hypothetical protein M3O28_14350, partial [Actinomycetota bacterium]|nr:hypothetical protein [Actinomycetota bacterium]